MAKEIAPKKRRSKNMALTRKFLSALDIDSDKIDEIINAHSDTVEALKTERDLAKKEAEQYRDDAKKLPDVQKELDDLKSQGNGVFETRYNEMKEAHDKLKKEFDQYKSDVDAKEVTRAKETAYRKLLSDAKISDKRIDKILKVSDLKDLELDKEGKFKDEDNLIKSIKDEWGEFIVEQHKQGAGVSNPPGNNTQVPRGESRAAKIAAQYHNNLYGESKEEK